MARMDIGFGGIEGTAEAGTPDALFELGIRYATGLEGPVDLVVAHKWFNLAAMRGSRPALDYRKDLAAEMTAAEIAEAQRQARQWLVTEKVANEKLASEAQAVEPGTAGLRGVERLAAERLAIEAFAAERFGAALRDDDNEALDEPAAREIKIDGAGRLAA